MAAILGVDRWRTAYDVWLEKTGKLDPRAETEAMMAGNVFERSVLDYAEINLGRLRRNVPMVMPGTPLMANVDAICRAGGQDPVEAKTAGLFGPLSEFWGADGTDQIPDRVIIQAHVLIMCRRYWDVKRIAEAEAPAVDVCHVPAFLGGRGFALFHVRRNDRICDLIAETAIAFWENNVQADIPPDDSAATLAVAKRMIRDPGKVSPLADDLVAEWVEAKAAVREAEAAANTATARILSALGDAEAGQTTGRGAMTYYEQTRRGYTVGEKTYRVLRHKPKAALALAYEPTKPEPKRIEANRHGKNDTTTTNRPGDDRRPVRTNRG